MAGITTDSSSSLASFALHEGTAFSSLANLPGPAANLSISRGAKAAREFEAQLIASVLESMEKTFAALPGQNVVAGQDDYNYLGTQALASAIADGGGFGIAKMISEHLQTAISGTGGAPR